ncbi:hypothetical protein FNV65_06515 [Streptomyces sp. S1A1-8]|uniref:hypothetical protein n=1 Tax=unclassified Streptomyces TaxID=2593676 RepID=UPI0011654098|nr:MULTISPECIES: hypothetical protein [unclassified Streptomyces]QDN95999.1 hypothetical protein FNV58_07945 [Streptomyces sp. RLB1-9]QDO17720.1 hypothetical protein FNV65_06515 [Streptomyces sp. S1A1-8]QDO27846.1 hypothetical protein FNV63_06505 [Streptomyces sp. S1A1-3]
MAAASIVFISQTIHSAQPGISLNQALVVAMSRRTFFVIPLFVSLLGLGLAPFGASAGDCDNFNGGICPPFSGSRRPPDFGDGWWNIQRTFTRDLVVEAPTRAHEFFLEPDRNVDNEVFSTEIIS